MDSGCNYSEGNLCYWDDYWSLQSTLLTSFHLQFMVRTTPSFVGLSPLFWTESFQFSGPSSGPGLPAFCLKDPTTPGLVDGREGKYASHPPKWCTCPRGEAACIAVCLSALDSTLKGRLSPFWRESSISTCHEENGELRRWETGRNLPQRAFHPRACSVRSVLFDP